MEQTTPKQSLAWETIKIIVISIAIIFPIRYYIVQPFFVRGASMESTLMNGDYLLVDEISYRFNDPQRGDMIVFHYPPDPSDFYIKRIIGLPGETVEIRNNKVTIYNGEGKVLGESYLSEFQQTLGDLVMRLKDNEYFVMGDNRLQSSDSRRWGALERKYIVGRAFVRLWPFNSITKLERINYQ